MIVTYKVSFFFMLERYYVPLLAENYNEIALYYQVVYQRNVPVKVLFLTQFASELFL